MNQQQRDDLIERYIGRRMSPVEEREFLRLLDRDDTLRRMIETERAVGTTLLRDRDAIPTSDLDTREQLLAMLGTLPPAGAGGGALAAASKGSGFFAGTIFKGGVALLLTGAVVGVGYLLTGDSPDGAQPRPHAASTTAVPQPSVDVPGSASSPTPSLPPSPISIERHDVKKMEGIVTERSKGDDAALHSERTPHLERSKERPATEIPASSMRTDLEKPSSTIPDVNSASAVETAQSTKVEEPALQTPRTRDTMRVNVSINLDRIGKRPR